MQNKHLSMLRSYRVFLPLALIALVFLGMFLFKTQMASNRSLILDACGSWISKGGHIKSKNHYHMQLDIVQDGKKIIIPTMLGISGDCIHPIHTHDISGTIHVDYPQRVDFRLGDFFDMMGQVFTDKQIGRLKTVDGYSISVNVNGKEIKKDFRNILLEDQQKVTIRITSPKQ